MIDAGRRKPGAASRSICSCAPRDAGGSERIGEKRRDVVTGADDDQLAARMMPALVSSRPVSTACTATPRRKTDAAIGGEPRRQRGDSRPRLDTQVAAAEQCAPASAGRGKRRDSRGRLAAGPNQRALIRHFRIEKRRQNRGRFRSPGDHHQSGLLDCDARPRGDFGPDVARAAGALPDRVRALGRLR